MTSELCLTIQATRNNIQCCEHAFFTPSALFLSLYPMNSCEDDWKAELHWNPKVCLHSMHLRPVSLATGMAGSLVSFFFLSPRAVCITFCKAPVKGCCPRRFGTPYLDRDVAVFAGIVAIKLRPVQEKHFRSALHMSLSRTITKLIRQLSHMETRSRDSFSLEAFQCLYLRYSASLNISLN